MKHIRVDKLTYAKFHTAYRKLTKLTPHLPPDALDVLVVMQELAHKFEITKHTYKPRIKVKVIEL
jgi:hypothetical protein